MILPSYTFYGGNAVFVPVHLFFTAAHFDLGGRYHFSFSYRRYKIFMFVFQQIGRKIENWFPCFFNPYLAFPRLCRNLNLVLRKTGLWCCCFFFFSFKVPVAMRFTTKNTLCRSLSVAHHLSSVSCTLYLLCSRLLI